ncbi:hypothetical protein BDV28DRAFT_140968 [Aspergillus coremiiformis]|uniref:Uncharacterized protein n=1 Tax=Aspergillus coremiiformis TaxID=138285 RepID=A0A5N6YVV9_9EURO|nr:hypothetical protein BDV28DRAFT_140968 [Aspergillus coremiiformis]
MTVETYLIFRFLAFFTIRAQRCTPFAFAPIYHCHNCKGRRLLFRLCGKAAFYFIFSPFWRNISCDSSPFYRRNKKDTKTRFGTCFLLALFLWDNSWMSWVSIC